MSEDSTFFQFLITDEDAGERLDVFLANQDEPPLSRSQVRRFLDRGEILVNQSLVKAGYRLRHGDQIQWTYSPPPKLSTAPEPIALKILYEDDDLAIIDKPAGMVVHPAPGHPDGTLVNALTYHFEHLSRLPGELRPGIVHRLDRHTSGAIAVTFSDEAHRHLAEQFRTQSAERTYHALVFGPGLNDEGRFETGHGRHPTQRMRFTGADESSERRAITDFRVLERFDSQTSLVECQLKTGRTHQIRMHLSEAGAPILGDQLYGGRAASAAAIIARQALHAHTLGLERLDGQWIQVHADYPQDFRQALESLRAGKDWR